MERESVVFGWWAFGTGLCFEFLARFVVGTRPTGGMLNGKTGEGLRQVIEVDLEALSILPFVEECLFVK